MQETIGNVELDYTYYPGKDLYSDGAVEDILLDIAQRYEEKEYDRVIAEYKSWPVLYHFSRVRTNIITWMPFTGTEKALEIGAGCGAITGALADRCGSVDCIDLSKKRSYVNAYRNREKKNIRIHVGNFQDIEKNMTEQYDIITLIGVFEYAKGYIGTSAPYVNFLKQIERHLAPNGRIVIAIENRLGMKYWAGATEDHAGKYFEGIEGYQNTDWVRTFSRQELEQIIGTAGNFKTEFYYPYPDYKLPTAIYSDAYLPKRGELYQNLNNFDRERIQLFDEEKAFDSMIDSRMFSTFSNSYLVVLERKAVNG